METKNISKKKEKEEARLSPKKQKQSPGVGIKFLFSHCIFLESEFLVIVCISISRILFGFIFFITIEDLFCSFIFSIL